MTTDEMVRTWRPSECGRYRYELARRWSPDTGDRSGVLVWIMLNPSTADGTVDDPTILQVIARSRHLGYAGALVVNLLAWRSAHPSKLPRDRSAIGPDNDRTLQAALRGAGPYAIAAWGNATHPWCEEMIPKVVEYAHRAEVELRALGQTMHGHPKHPLARGRHRIPAAAAPASWSVP